ncbi:hypothetical protein SUGI_0367180 [Cryptomeria japonica]|nr:hypothetical protein SUGI_0367180 [Cryptomeria japonica]
MEGLKRIVVRIAYTADDHFREKLYTWGIFKPTRLAVPVISVGNLTWGGNGKTPMTEFLALLFVEAGISPLILIRGYAGGDETRMLQRHLIDTAIKIGSGPNRGNIAASFLQQYGVMKCNRKSDSTGNVCLFKDCDTFANKLGNEIGVIILDDGMQHWSLSRDLDIVMLNCINLWGNGHMIPRGPLRESLKELRWADLIVLHHADLLGAAHVDRVDFCDHHNFQNKDLNIVQNKLQCLKDEFGNKAIIVLTEKDYERSHTMFSKVEALDVLVLHSTLTILCSGNSKTRLKTMLLNKVIRK